MKVYQDMCISQEALYDIFGWVAFVLDVPDADGIADAGNGYTG